MMNLLVSVAVSRVCGLLVVVPASTDGVAHPSHQHHDQAYDEEDDADDHAYVSEREGRNEAGEEESEDDEDDSEDDHDDYLISAQTLGGGFTGARIPRQRGRSKVCMLSRRDTWIWHVRRELMLIEFSGGRPDSFRTG
jgi:hypothetical protein